MSRKTFKEKIDPAMSFISQASIDRAEEEQLNTMEPPQTQQPSAKAPAGYKPNPLYIETKSERLQLLVQPSLKAKLKERAAREGTSVNDLVHNILHSAVVEEAQ